MCLFLSDLSFHPNIPFELLAMFSTCVETTTSDLLTALLQLEWALVQMEGLSESVT